MIERVTMVTAGCGPLGPDCGVELCCPEGRWPEPVLSVQSAPAPTPARQTTTNKQQQQTTTTGIQLNIHNNNEHTTCLK